MSSWNTLHETSFLPLTALVMVFSFSLEMTVQEMTQLAKLLRGLATGLTKLGGELDCPFRKPSPHRRLDSSVLCAACQAGCQLLTAREGVPGCDLRPETLSCECFNKCYPFQTRTVIASSMAYQPIKITGTGTQDAALGQSRMSGSRVSSKHPHNLSGLQGQLCHRPLRPVGRPL